jgi:hypothetical protein
LKLGSNLSVNSSSRTKLGFSLFQTFSCGSTLSTRALFRQGTLLSLYKKAGLSNFMSVLHEHVIASSISIRHSNTIFGSSVSVFETFQLGSNMSIRNFVMCEKLFSVNG